MLNRKVFVVLLSLIRPKNMYFKFIDCLVILSHKLTDNLKYFYSLYV